MSGQWGQVTGVHTVPAALFVKTCDNCEGVEERLFVDSWTGKELCLTCLAPIVNQITMSPASDGDNLPELLDGQ